MRNHTIGLHLSSPIVTEGVKMVLRGMSGVTLTDKQPADLTIVDTFTVGSAPHDRTTILLTATLIPDTADISHLTTISIYEPAETIREKIRQLLQPNPTDSSSRGDDLTPREKEVILGIVKGLANKEIAAEMNVSVNTIMTHRRNIAAKLQIHSPAGLTIFAIATGLIKIDDVKL
ncbi:response regulator transcription factor [uncultured Duncaniella sp.]|uniref:response regulator transcription factor n=1 Tax=uncultured Duncaniella sp. TaxID=2768039 RepID=UPI0025D172C8|nr:LuxR C-terminal-related transcriptional regulator [uncultured Duncaniella sp.]